MMTKMHFIAVANVINDAMENMDQPRTDASFLTGKVAGIEEVAEGLADLFSDINGAFDRDRFFKACGLDKTK